MEPYDALRRCPKCGTKFGTCEWCGGCDEARGGHFHLECACKHRWLMGRLSVKR